MNCNALSLIDMKKYGERTVDYINRMKEYFNQNIKCKTFIFNGLEAKILFCDDADEDRSWRKFSVGDEKGHNYTDKIDRYRLPFLPLLPYILENLENCKICDKIEISQERTNNYYRIVFKCLKNWYKIVLSKDEVKNCYYIISAYVDRRLKKSNS